LAKVRRRVVILAGLPFGRAARTHLIGLEPLAPVGFPLSPLQWIGLKAWTVTEERFRRTAKLSVPLFWATLAFTFYMAVKPPGKGPDLFPWDKAEHFTAFYVLMGLAAAAYPRRPLWLTGLLLSAFGGLIELVQALPIVHRDCDFWDWVADTIGVLAV